MRVYIGNIKYANINFWTITNPRGFLLQEFGLYILTWGEGNEN